MEIQPSYIIAAIIALAAFVGYIVKWVLGFVERWAQKQAEEQARGQREIKRPFAGPCLKVARQPAEERNLLREKKRHTEKDEGRPRRDKNVSRAFHDI